MGPPQVTSGEGRRDTLVGREAQHDSITGEVISPALSVSAAGASLWPRYIADPDRARPIRDALRSAALAVDGSCAALAASPLPFKFVADDPGAVPIVQQVPWIRLVALWGFLTRSPCSMRTSRACAGR
jgi:hypothetical protein